MSAFQLNTEAFIETYTELRRQWQQLDKKRAELEKSRGHAERHDCTVMGGVDFARQKSGEDADGLLQEVNRAHADLSTFLTGAHGAFEQYKKNQDDGAMRLKVIHPDEGAAGGSENETARRAEEVVRRGVPLPGESSASDGSVTDLPRFAPKSYK